jgi:Ras-related protein Rab-6A
MFIETSAKEGFNIKLLFRRLATALPALESNGAESTEQAQVVNLTTVPPASASGGGNGDSADSASSYCGC